MTTLTAAYLKLTAAFVCKVSENAENGFNTKVELSGLGQAEQIASTIRFIIENDDIKARLTAVYLKLTAVFVCKHTANAENGVNSEDV